MSKLLPNWRVCFDESAEPKTLPLSLLGHITSGFPDDKEIVYGGYARVCKVCILPFS
jgi:hypothetical protein